eukprot:10550610-Lingulodinium_polyedra.AAC.1
MGAQACGAPIAPRPGSGAVARGCTGLDTANERRGQAHARGGGSLTAQRVAHDDDVRERSCATRLKR